jgi:short-subunit dehydrogenase
MRESLSRHGVKLSVVCPGYMHSHMMDNFEGFTPFAWSTQKAAAYIAEKLTKDPRIISFPFLLNAITGIDTLLPNFITRPFKKKFSFRVKN